MPLESNGINISAMVTRIGGATLTGLSRSRLPRYYDALVLPPVAHRSVGIVRDGVPGNDEGDVDSLPAVVVHVLDFAPSQMGRKFVNVSASILADLTVGVDGQRTVRVDRDDDASDVCLHRERRRFDE